MGTPELWNDTELSEFLRISRRTLQAWRQEGKGPKWLKLGRHVRYRPSDVSAWLEEREGKLTAA